MKELEIICENCGEKTPSNVSHCVFCGTELSSSSDKEGTSKTMIYTNNLMNEKESWFIERMINFVNRIESPIGTNPPSFIEVLLKGKKVQKPTKQNIVYNNPFFVFIIDELFLILGIPLIGALTLWIGIYPLAFLVLIIPFFEPIFNLNALGQLFIIFWLCCVIVFPVIYFGIRASYPSRIFSIAQTHSQTVPSVSDRRNLSSIQMDSHTPSQTTTLKKEAPTLNNKTQNQASGQHQVHSIDQVILFFIWCIVCAFSLIGTGLTQNALFLLIIPITIIVMFVYFDRKIKKRNQT